MMKIFRQLLLFVMSLILLFSACDGFSQRSQEFPGDTEISLNCDGKDAELVFSRREIADENVEYEVGEVFNFHYIYIFTVSDNTDFKSCKLVFSDG